MAPIDHTAPTSRLLLHDILKRVSRSFFLTLSMLPRPVRDQMGLAYLFARAADTIADTDLIERHRRLELLNRFSAQFAGDQVDKAEIAFIRSALVSQQAVSGERVLLEHLDDCFHLYGTFDPPDRARIRRLMGTLTKGMEMDLTVFTGGSARHVTALQTGDDLDRYIYYVAGCVGEFWTEMVCAHLPSVKGWNVDEMGRVGVRFGKGLQLTNVVKDVARDLQRGRCYIPHALLRDAGLDPSDLLNKQNHGALKPVLAKLIVAARDHLDQGWLYTMAIPRREMWLRLACMWPILFAGETLRLVSESPALLDSAVNVKISKRRVYGIMAMTLFTGGCGYAGTAYWGRLRKMIG